MAHGWQGRLRRRARDFFLPCCCETAMLEEGVSNHRHERMTVEALPGPTFEVIGPSSSFSCWWACSQIHRALMSRQGAQTGLRRQVAR